MAEFNQQQFNKGINRRFDIERGDPERLYTLQNARLQDRGDTFSISRIEGFSAIANDATSYENVLDSIFFQDELVIYWYDSSTSESVITFIDINGGGTNEFRFSSTQPNYGELTLLEDNIYIAPFNKQLNFIDGTWRLNDFISTTPIIFVVEDTGGTLDLNTYYWYKARFVYNDGHRTKTCYSDYQQTTGGAINVDILNSQTDLDGNFADVEIFRKKEGGEWFLIDRVTPDAVQYRFTDDGKAPLDILDEKNYIWDNNHRSQDIVRDRLVRANLEYKDKFLGWNEGDVTFSLTSGTDSDSVHLPKNSTMEIYGQGRYNDGTLTPHKKLGELNIGDVNEGFKTDPQVQPSNIDDIHEAAYFAKFKPKVTPTITFNSLEIYNANVPSLATKFKSEAEQDKPINPHIFLGYKYVTVETVPQASSGEVATDSNKDFFVSDEDWNYDGTSYVGTDDSTNDDRWNGRSESSTPIWASNPPETITLDFSGNGVIDRNTGSDYELTYKLKYQDVEGNLGGQFNEYIYELALVEPLKKAISEGKLKIKLTSLAVNSTLSTDTSNFEFLDQEVDVVGFLDTSGSRQSALHTTGDILYSTGKNHFYLVVDQDSIYGDYDNDVNNDDVLADYDNSALPNLDNVFKFDLINIEEKDFGGSTTTEPYSENNNITQVNVDYGLQEFSPIKETTDEALYLGRQDDIDQDTTFSYSNFWDGYETVKSNLFQFQTLHAASIFESLILEEDLEQFQQDYPNQFIWGGPFIIDSNASGTRNFDFVNFKNISQDYGEIIKISYINNTLLAFCERGVNRVIVGEVLTQQTGGEVFVDSSRLLNNDVWILKNIPEIQPRSIKQYENSLYFCDGKDVWKYTDQLQNITNGKLDLDISNSFIGVIDPKNKEYLLNNGGETWAYSIELDQWQGPYTFDIETGSAFEDNFYGIVNSDSVQFNTGNTFNGSSYKTLIESVANLPNKFHLTKQFRKFYLDVEGIVGDNDVTFSYSDERGNWIDNDINDYPVKERSYNIGIDKSKANSKEIFWKFDTDLKDFVLEGISFMYNIKRRR